MVLYVWRYNETTAHYEKTSVIDSATSIIWVTRFNSVGQFEIYLPMSRDIYRLFFDYMHDVLVTRDDSDTVMIVEDLRVTTDPDNGDYLTVTGTDGGGILARRIIPAQTNFTGTAENFIRALIDQNIINPDDTRRKISMFTLETAHGWTDEIERQVTGKNLLDTICDICAYYVYGFKVTFDGQNFKFSLYKGTDHSQNQNENPLVIFSPGYENIQSTTFVFGKSAFKTAVYVAGEGQGSERIINLAQYAGEDTGMWRREMWEDSRNTSQTTDSGQIPLSDYKQMLYNQGVETLRQNLYQWEFNAECINTDMYKYGVDYGLGDKVTAINQYHIGANATVSEITEVEDAEGYRLIPTFSDWSV